MVFDGLCQVACLFHSSIEYSWSEVGYFVCHDPVKCTRDVKAGALLPGALLTMCKLHLV